MWSWSQVTLVVMYTHTHVTAIPFLLSISKFTIMRLCGLKYHNGPSLLSVHCRDCDLQCGMQDRTLSLYPRLPHSLSPIPPAFCDSVLDTICRKESSSDKGLGTRKGSVICVRLYKTFLVKFWVRLLHK